MIITLLTDFGLQDSYAGIMKGVILGIAPEVRIVDITHGIPPQDVSTVIRNKPPATRSRAITVSARQIDITVLAVTLSLFSSRCSPMPKAISIRAICVK